MQFRKGYKIQPGEDLSGADLSGADLSGADLSGADLSPLPFIDQPRRGTGHPSSYTLAGMSEEERMRVIDLVLDNHYRRRIREDSPSSLSEADLSGADLSGADLSGANLSGANLSGADLSGANLSGANLSGANLSGANLSGANLSGTDLSGADLSGADIKGPYCDESTIWPEGYTPPVDSKLPDLYSRESGSDG